MITPPLPRRRARSSTPRRVLINVSKLDDALGLLDTLIRSSDGDLVHRRGSLQSVRNLLVYGRHDHS